MLYQWKKEKWTHSGGLSQRRWEETYRWHHQRGSLGCSDSVVEVRINLVDSGNPRPTAKTYKGPEEDLYRRYKQISIGSRGLLKRMIEILVLAREKREGL